jgi:hypothetical protein
MPKPKDPFENPNKKSVKRLEALKRKPLYRQEFEAAFQSYRTSLPKNRVGNPYYDIIESFQLTDEGRKLCQRWDISSALSPDDKLWNENAPYWLKDPGNAVEVIPHGAPKFIPEEGRLDYTPLLKDGRYLHLEIDLSHKKGQIEAEFAHWVKWCQDLIINEQVRLHPRTHNKNPLPPDSLSTEQWIAERNKQKAQEIDEIRKQLGCSEKDNKYNRRGKSPDIIFDENLPGGPVTIFEIWDMHKEESKSAWQITKELYPDITSTYPQSWDIDEDTSKLSPEAQQARNCLRKVERAIKKAQEEIDSINPTE